MKHFDFSLLSRCNESASQCFADLRSQTDYFQVSEYLPFEADGTGGHAWLYIEKQGINTDWLAGELAKFSGVKQVAIGYAGLKDRHAVTRQWFSINLEGFDEPDWSQFETEKIKIVQRTRHGKKLKRGVLSGNQFKLRLTNVEGDADLWQSALEQIAQYGVPNYFGEQRFGHNAGNLHRVEYWFTSGKAPRKRNQKSIYLSAGRSWLFNLVLSQRIKQKNWNTAVAGDVMLLAGTKASHFNVDSVDTDLITRLNTMDIHPTGPMWGRGRLDTGSDCQQLEQQALLDWHDWQQGLEKAGLKQERRSLRLFPKNFTWQFLADKQLELSFFLPAGCYATAVMRELAVITDVQQRNFHSNQALSTSEGLRDKEAEHVDN